MRKREREGGWREKERERERERPPLNEMTELGLGNMIVTPLFIAPAAGSRSQ